MAAQFFQLLHSTELRHFPEGKNQNAIMVQDCAQPVRDSDLRSLAASAPVRCNGGLHSCICRGIHRRGRLVQQEDLGVSHHCSGHAKQLTLTNRQIIPTLCNSPFQATVFNCQQAHTPYRLEQCRIVTRMSERIQIRAECSREHHRVLRDDRKCAADGPQAQFADVVTINRDHSSFWSDNPKQCTQQTGLSSPCSPANSQSLPSVNLEGNTFENQGSVPVPHRHAVERHPTNRPLRR
mmetsp:Transcript_75223/g.200820  ORF Transcript_75223/g.200820 Transcript_75223/m.200820 type:complete len:237 (+) Transcript_75223:157-867(+)